MELKRLTAAVDEAEALLERLRQSLNGEHDTCITLEEQDERHIQSLELFQSVSASQPDLEVRIQKFVEKLNWKDPITNEPRYGPSMQTKIRELHERIQALASTIASTAHEVEPKATNALQNQQARIEEARALEAQRLEQARLEAARAEQQALEAKRVAEIEQKEAERIAQQEREALARAAQAVREERARAQAEKEKKEAEAKAALEQLNQSIPIGLEGLQTALGMLATSITDAKQLRQAQTTLYLLLKNICAAPENPNFRQIKASNEHFHKDLGQHVGGVQCLLAIGFRPLSRDDEIVFMLEARQSSCLLDVMLAILGARFGFRYGCLECVV
ncbi:unnamed protein product [Aphanomyces euteiches]|nr:hypothetical protein AeRB84_016867 [Aphanomyces euteiches]